jgi:hypothetical protein
MKWTPLAQRGARRGDAADHLLHGQAEVLLRERLPLADVLAFVLRQRVDGPHGSILPPATLPGSFCHVFRECFRTIGRSIGSL